MSVFNKPDIIIIVLAITILCLLIYLSNVPSCPHTEGFVSGTIPAEALANVTSVVEQNFITMPYMIVLFKGPPTSIPQGWALCDGQNGTPNLTDKFVVCAGTTYAEGTTGGSRTVTLTTNNMPPHTHTGTTASAGSHRHRLKDCASDDGGGRDNDVAMGDPNDNRSCPNTDSAGAHTHTFTTASTGGGQPFNIDPPYYALAYIMKLPPT